MAYVRVPDPNLNEGKPARSVDIKQIRDNQDFFNTEIEELQRARIITDQDIRDHFMASNLSVWPTVVDDLPYNWEDLSAAGGAVTFQLPGIAQFDINGATDMALLAATDGRQRIAKSHEYIAYCEARVKRTTEPAIAFAFGWQDNGLAETSVYLTDQSDCVIVLKNGSDWEVRTANGGSASTATLGATATNWNIIRLEFTCSATAGNRKVEAYLNDTLVTTLNTDANMPTALLRPFIGVFRNAAGAMQMQCDWIEFGWLTKPLAA